MPGRSETQIGSITLKNPVICAAGEHVMTAAGIRAGILWLQCGGSRLTLVFGRRRLIEAAQGLLQDLSAQGPVQP